MVDVKDLRPYVMRMIPSARRRLATLPSTRKSLKADLRAMVRKIGPSMGKMIISCIVKYQFLRFSCQSNRILCRLR